MITPPAPKPWRRPLRRHHLQYFMRRICVSSSYSCLPLISRGGSRHAWQAQWHQPSCRWHLASGAISHKLACFVIARQCSRTQAGRWPRALEPPQEQDCHTATRHAKGEKAPKGGNATTDDCARCCSLAKRTSHGPWPIYLRRAATTPYKRSSPETWTSTWHGEEHVNAAARRETACICACMPACTRPHFLHPPTQPSTASIGPIWHCGVPA